MDLSWRICCRTILLLGLLFVDTSRAPAQNAPRPSQSASETATAIPAYDQTYAKFDPVAATNAYLATVPADKRARSNAYFEGGYWLQLWDFLIGAAINLFLLAFGWSAKLRDFVERVTRFRFLQAALYLVLFTLISFVLALPMTIYEGYFREHAYGLANQTFGPWFREQLIGLTIGLIIGGIAVGCLFAVIRKLGKTWWVWGAVGSIVLILFVQLIAPVFIFPLFNTYTKLSDAKVRDPILSLARANNIPVNEVYEVDASRQSNRVSANVSGFLGTERITLNDNLLKRCTPEEILGVMGHEMGHYVLNHVYTFSMFLIIVTVMAFAFLNWSLNLCLRRWGPAWRISEVADLAVLPLAILLLSLISFVGTPIFNTAIRTQEAEADMFGLNAAQQPDGEALVDLKLGEYRKLDPSPMEEFVFFDHPSGRNRILMAMRWKKEHLPGAPLAAPNASGTTK